MWHVLMVAVENRSPTVLRPLAAALGVPGLTAYVGLTRFAEVREGDTVFVSGAAGAVGSIAGQIAKLRGAAWIVGSAGSDDKVKVLELEAAIGALKLHARIVLSGMVAQYNDEKVVGPRNLWNMSVTRSRLLAFMVTEELDLQPEFVREVGGWLREGNLHHRETVVDGIHNTLDAFLGLMRGENLGKMIVQL